MIRFGTADAPIELAVHGRSICGLSFNQEGILYGVDSNSDELVTFDTETGAVDTVVPIMLDDKPVNIVRRRTRVSGNGGR